MKEYAECLEDLSEILRDILWGNGDRVDALFQYTAGAPVPGDVARLAEIIGTLVVQKEVREYQLECLIEELLSARTELEQARHDATTGLPNRTMFNEILQKACAQNERSARGLALLLIDFDHFKQINDTYGHDAGDELLAKGAARLQAGVGANGVVGRMGGDEFTVILVGQSEDEAMCVARNLLAMMREPFELKSGKARISASIGIAFHAAGDTPVRLMKNADVAMYRSKSEGRNRLSRYRPSTFARHGQLFRHR